MNTFFFHLTQRIEPFYQEVWLKALSRVSKKDSKNVTLVKGLIEFNLFYELLINMTQKSWSLFFFFNMTRRIGPFLFSNMTQRIELFQNAQEIEPLFHMNYFFTWLELNSFLINTTKSQRVELSSQKMTQRKRWTPFRNMTHRIEFFWNEKDSLNWTLLFNMTHSIEPFFSTWLKEWIFFWLTQKIEPCVKRKVSKSGTFFSEVKNCFLSFSTWLEELIFLNMSQWIEPFSWIWPTELNLFSIWLKEFWTFQKNDSLNWTFFCKKNDSKNVLKKSKNDSTNWTFQQYDSQNWSYGLTRKCAALLLCSLFRKWMMKRRFCWHVLRQRWYDSYLRSQAIISKACKRLLVTSRWTSPTDREGSCVIWILPSSGRGTSPPWIAPRSPLRSWNMCHQCLPRHALRLLRVHQFKNKMSSPLRRVHRSVFNRAPLNKLCACQSLLCRSKW